MCHSLSAPKLQEEQKATVPYIHGSRQFCTGRHANGDKVSQTHFHAVSISLAFKRHSISRIQQLCKCRFSSKESSKMPVVPMHDPISDRGKRGISSMMCHLKPFASVLLSILKPSFFTFSVCSEEVCTHFTIVAIPI